MCKWPRKKLLHNWFSRWQVFRLEEFTCFINFLSCCELPQWFFKKWYTNKCLKLFPAIIFTCNSNLQGMTPPTPFPRVHCYEWREKKGQIKLSRAGVPLRTLFICHLWLLPRWLLPDSEVPHITTLTNTPFDSRLSHHRHGALTAKQRTVKSGCGSCFAAPPRVRTLEDRLIVLC